MSHLTVPNQVILRLAWSDLPPLFQALRQSVNEFLVVTIWGYDRAICEDLQQVWQQTFPPFLRKTTPSFGVKSQNAAISTQSEFPSSGQAVNHSRSYPFSSCLTLTRLLSRLDGLSDGEDEVFFSLIEAGAEQEQTLLEKMVYLPKAMIEGKPTSENRTSANLLILAPSLQVWIQVEPILSFKLFEVESNLLRDAAIRDGADQWQVSLSFDQQEIGRLLTAPTIAALIPFHAGFFVDSQLSNKSLQKFWANLLQLPQLASASPPILSPSTARLQPLSTNFLFKQAPIGIIYLGLDGGITRANPAFCRLTGYTETQLRRLDNRKISFAEDFAIEMRSIQQMVNQGQRSTTLRKRYLCCDGSLLWAEVKLSLVEDEAGESEILTFVTDLSDRKRAEQEIQQSREREDLLNDISAQIRNTLDLQTILQAAVERLRRALDTDRVLAYQFYSDLSGICTAEDVALAYPKMLGQKFSSECIPSAYLNAYRQGRLWTLVDVHAAKLTPCFQKMLNQFQVHGLMTVAIVSMDESLELHNRTLWGLLVVHHCQGPRQWTEDEQQLIRAVANQISAALEQTRLLHQLQIQTQELEARVSQRTKSLAQSLKFEQLIRNLTETLRTDLDEDQMLKAAVEGLVKTLDADGCISSLFNPQNNLLEIRYEFFKDLACKDRSLVGKTFPLTRWSEGCRQQLLNRKTYVHNVLIDQDTDLHPIDPSLERFRNSDHLETPLSAQAISSLISPIVDDQGLIGVLTVFQLQSRRFESDEINLIEQVASQCAIALRQAHLYRQQHEQRLSAEHFRLFLEKSTDVFVEYDLDFRYVSINPAGCEFLGAPRNKIIGKTNRELLGLVGENLESLIQRAFDTGEKVFVDHEFHLPDGPRVFEIVYAPIVNPVGTVQRIIGIGRDVTELKQHWQLLETRNHELTETTRLKEEFVATTSHELRTPLTAILGFSNVLLQEFFGELNPKQKDYLERIHTSGQHLLDLINDILDLSRLEAERLELDLQTIFVPDVCEGVISLIQERAVNQGLRLEVDLDPHVDWVVADPRRLKQMLLNLLINAVKFTQEGTIGLKVYREPNSTSQFSSEAPPVAGEQSYTTPADMIHFLIWDTGIGIDEVNQKLLFTPFAQIDSSLSRKHQGTGLGLVITRKLAELHGGTVTLESSPNQGARFTISLPIQEGGQ